jgi:pimeloyl-ACP methyl ester carboxylesterase
LDGRPATVVGHSYGGAVAMRAANDEPRIVKALGVFEAPVPWMPWWPAESVDSAGAELLASGPDSAAAAELFVRRQLGDRAWEEMPEPTQAERRSEGEALLSDLASLSATEPLFDPAGIASPMVVGRGTDSVGYQYLAAARLSEAAGAELVDIDGGGHASHVTHPEEFAKFVRRAVSLSE